MSAVSPQSVCLYKPDDTPLFPPPFPPCTFSPSAVCARVLANMPCVCLVLLRFNLCHPATVETAPLDALYCFPPVLPFFPPENPPQFVCLVKQNLFSLQLIAFYSIATCQANSFKLSTPLAQEFSAAQHHPPHPPFFLPSSHPCSMNFLAHLACCAQAERAKNRGVESKRRSNRINKNLFSGKPTVSVHSTKK